VGLMILRLMLAASACKDSIGTLNWHPQPLRLFHHMPRLHQGIETWL